MDPQASDHQADDAPNTPTKPKHTSTGASSKSSHASPQHEYTDSMVTIRLSDARQADASKGTDETDSTVTDRKSESTDLHLDTANVPTQVIDQEALSATREEAVIPEPPAKEPENVDSENGNKVRFEEEGAKHTRSDTTSLEQTGTLSNMEDQPLESARSSNSSFACSTPAEAGTLGEELERCTVRVRSNSMGSSSSENAQVDWAELDKNEEQEQRGDATDEASE